jgi:hypothetical protein
MIIPKLLIFRGRDDLSAAVRLALYVFDRNRPRARRASGFSGEMEARLADRQRLAPFGRAEAAGNE